MDLLASITIGSKFVSNDDRKTVGITLHKPTIISCSMSKVPASLMIKASFVQQIYVAFQKRNSPGKNTGT